MISRRGMLQLGAAGASAMALPGALVSMSKPAAARTAVDFEVPSGACDCSRPRVRGSEEVPVRREAALHAARGFRRRAHRAAAFAQARSRGDRAAERIRRRQFLHDRRHPPARRARTRRRGDREGDVAVGLGGNERRRHPRRAAQSGNQHGGTVRPRRSSTRPRRRSPVSAGTYRCTHGLRSLRR